MIVERKGDLLESGLDVICHQVNCQGVMGSGIALQIKMRYPEVYASYRKYFESSKEDDLLGSVQFVETNQSNLTVVNIFAQRNYGMGERHTSYDAFWDALQKIKKNIPPEKTIGFPCRIGSFRGGASWAVIRTMIEEVFNDREVYIYDFDKN